MRYRITGTLAALLTLSACATQLPPTQVPSKVAPAWQAALPHSGEVAALTQWWQRQGDPLLVELIAAAQAVSPSVGQALARIESSRAAQASAKAALLPNLGVQASVSRGGSQLGVPLASTLQGGLQASWELDLIGANRAVSQAAQAQVEGSQAQWHDARVSVAAEVATLYFGLRHCTEQLMLTRLEADSQHQTARLSQRSAAAGLLTAAQAALAQAYAAQANSRLTQHDAMCQTDTKALVALTALAEPDLKQKLALAHFSSAPIKTFSIAALPVQAVSQRPDVFVAERDVVQASAQVGSAQARRWPRLTLNGALGGERLNRAGVTTEGLTWSFGPLALSLPLFDGGQRVALVQAAQANYQAVVQGYQARVRQAVREVEEALVNLHSVQARQPDAELSQLGIAQSLAATQSRFDHGLANLLELEESKRLSLAAQSSLLALMLERQRAWVALYRAVGGGFDPVDATTALAGSDHTR